MAPGDRIIRVAQTEVRSFQRQGCTRRQDEALVDSYVILDFMQDTLMKHTTCLLSLIVMLYTDAVAYPLMAKGPVRRLAPPAQAPLEATHPRIRRLQLAAPGYIQGRGSGGGRSGKATGAVAAGPPQADGHHRPPGAAQVAASIGGR